MDLVLVLGTTPLWGGLVLIVAGIVRLMMGRPVIFRQERPGLQGRQFTVLKFRTMAERCGPDGNLLPDDQRLGRFGRFLRATSLDELPELWNVVLGEMSLVGPRPLLVQYLDRYSPHQARRHEVKPGITGWAQVNGRNALTWNEKFELDVWYVDHVSLWLDLKILGMTIWKTIRREDISHPGQVTMSEFFGSIEGSERLEGKGPDD